MGLIRFLVGSIIGNCSLGTQDLLSGILNWRRYLWHQLTTVARFKVVYSRSQLQHLTVTPDLMIYQEAHSYYTLFSDHFSYLIPSEKLIFFFFAKIVCIFEIRKVDFFFFAKSASHVFLKVDCPTNLSCTYWKLHKKEEEIEEDEKAISVDRT